MLLVAGLGNPDRKYEITRHNIGRRVVDYLAELPEASELKLLGSGWKPWQSSYMNELGIPLASYMHKNGTEPSDLLVIHDELDLPFGAIKMGAPGSNSAGHKGLESIIRELGNSDFHRIRIGIQTPEQASRVISAEEFVLRPFSADEETKLPELIKQAAELALQWSK